MLFKVVHNVIVWAVADKESKLKEIEEHFATLETERLSAFTIKSVSIFCLNTCKIAQESKSI